MALVIGAAWRTQGGRSSPYSTAASCGVHFRAPHGNPGWRLVAGGHRLANAAPTQPYTPHTIHTLSSRSNDISQPSQICVVSVKHQFGARQGLQLDQTGR